MSLRCRYDDVTQVCANGSPLELKTTYGSGYHLGLAFAQHAPDVASKVMAIVQKHVPPASIEDAQSKQLSISMPQVQQSCNRHVAVEAALHLDAAGATVM